jgi:hypothetical protein
MSARLLSEPDAYYSEWALNGLTLLANGTNGYLQAGWSSTYYLQEHATEARYRVIIVARQLSADQGMYVTATGLAPIDWGPGPFLFPVVPAP